MKTYVLTISQSFPAHHPKAGMPTDFPRAIKHYDKIHTIRGNYQLWAKRFEQINQGSARLSIRIWEGKPYKSKQLEIFQYNRTHGIGIEKLTFKEMVMTAEDCIIKSTKSGPEIFIPEGYKLRTLAQNDGLALQDFKDWFENYNLLDHMAIIHFTDFRYN